MTLLVPLARAGLAVLTATEAVAAREINVLVSKRVSHEEVAILKVVYPRISFAQNVLISKWRNNKIMLLKVILFALPFKIGDMLNVTKVINRKK